MHPALSPDGSRVAYTSNRTGSYEVWIGPRAGGSATQRTNFDGPFTGTPRWSPNGNMIAFDGRPDGTADIFVLDADGGTPRRVTEHPANDLASSWSRDGNSVYFASTRSGAWNVWRKAADGHGGEAIQVTLNGGFSALEAADGSGLFFTHAGQPGLWFLDFSNGEESQLPVDVAAEDWASWGVASDGVYYLRRGQPTTVMRFDPSRQISEEVFRLTGLVPHSDAAFSVSRDGQWLSWGQIDRQEVDLLSIGTP
jgi:Tol biopolymer transport system component